MFDNKSYTNFKKSSSKSFGITFAIFFLLLFFYLNFFHNLNLFIFLFLSLLFLIISFTKPNYLSLLNYLWLKLGAALSNLISPIVMLIIYYIIFTPYSFIIIVLRTTFSKKTENKSFWVFREEKINSMNKEY